MCARCADYDFPHAEIWRPCYQPKQPAFSRKIPTIQLKDCGEDRYEQTPHHPDDILENAKLRTTLNQVTKDLDRARRQQAKASTPDPDTFTSVLEVSNE